MSADDPTPSPSLPVDERPGGWVAGIGWVALDGDLEAGDQWAGPGARTWFQPPAELLNAPVIVTRWADGTTPAPPVPPTPAPEPDGGWLRTLLTMPSLCRLGQLDAELRDATSERQEDDTIAEFPEAVHDLLNALDALAATAPSAPAEQPQPDPLAELVEAVRAADAEYERTCLARQHAGSAYDAKQRARIALADAYLARPSSGTGGEG